MNQLLTTRGVIEPLSPRVDGMVDRALAWVNDNLDEFSPLTGERRFDMQRMKRFLELAVMITSCTTSPRDHEAALANPVALLATSLDQRGFVDWMIRYPSTLVQYLHIFTAYKSATNADHHHTTLLHRALESGFEEHIERAPHRVMEARMALDWAGLDDDIPSWEELLRNSIAGRLPSSLVIRDDAIYALTHVVMFATRYGIDGPERLRAIDLPRLARLLEDLMIPMCQERHWDLVGELLFSWDCLQLPPSPVVGRAWAAFLDAQENDGSFPPPPAALREHPDGPDTPSQPEDGDEDNGSRRFALRYHTVLVGIIAGCCHARRHSRSFGSSRNDRVEQGVSAC